MNDPKILSHARRRGSCVGRSRHARSRGERVRRIGVLLPAAAGDLEFQTRVGAFLQGCR